MTAPDRIRVAQDADGFWTCREAVSGSQEYVRADLYAALEEQLAVGWLYFNPDTGTEWAEQHPIESGEVPDAQNVRAATAANLLKELVPAWADLANETKARRSALEATPPMRAGKDEDHGTDPEGQAGRARTGPSRGRRG